MKLKPWWDTRLAQTYGAEKLALRLIAKRIVYTFDVCPVRPDNDSWTGN